MAKALAPSPDGFRARLSVVVDQAFADMDPALIAEIAEIAARATDNPVLFVADRQTFASLEHLVRCLQLPTTGRSFRSVPAMLWAVENNLSVANMDFEELVDQVDEAGGLRED